MRTYDFAVIGGGLAGLSTAYHLAGSGAGSILVVEKAAGPGREASGQNASMICRAAEDPLLSRMTAAGADLIRGAWGRKLGGVRFRRTGSLFIGTDKNLRKAVRGGRAERLSRAQILRRFPFLAESRFEGGLYFRADGILDSGSLVRALAARLQNRGVRILYRTRALPRRNARGLFEFAGGRFAARVVVNAAGAWAGEVAAAAGAQRLRIIPRKRHLFLTRPLDLKPRGWPIVWDVDRGVYFRPEGDALLLSPCDTSAAKPGPARLERSAERLLRKKLKVFLPAAQKAKMARAWAGLRTFSADGRFVIGWDGKAKNFFWAACLDGHGLVASAAVGQMSAALIRGRAYAPELEKAFSPRRFRRT